MSRRPRPETAILLDKKSASHVCNASLFVSMKTVIEMILLCLVGAEGRGRTRGRLTLRLLRSQHTAATADYLMVFTATICLARHLFTAARNVPRQVARLENKMKVMASVKKMCRKCKIIRRKRAVRVICTDPRHKQRQG